MTTHLFKQRLGSKLVLLFLLAVLCMPVSLLAQEQEDDFPSRQSASPAQELPSFFNQEIDPTSAPGSLNMPSLNYEDENEEVSSDGFGSEELSGSAGGGIRQTNPRGGSPLQNNVGPDNRDPNGNPDVPFDSNMNLAFLAIGLVFALVVYRRRVKGAEVKAKC